MAHCKDIMPRIVAVLNIVVGFIVAASGVLWIIHFLDHTGYIEYLFLAISMFVLGLILICVEIGFKKHHIYRELYLLGNYAGRGFYTLLFEYLFLLFIVLVFRL
jgi:hypothetical protein